LSQQAQPDFNALERRARIHFESREFSEALAIYYYMADGDPSLDAGYLGMRIGACYEALGYLRAAKYWYDRAVDENPTIPEYVEARRRLEKAIAGAP
jgi:tetratricopeptide (TPR) repeat protein